MMFNKTNDNYMLIIIMMARRYNQATYFSNETVDKQLSVVPK